MHEWILWVLLAASALHVVEEHALGWQGWAMKSMGERLKLQLTWSDFYVTNAALVIVGVASAAVGWKFAGFALGFAALNIINALFFHILPSIMEKRPNPGCITAVILYLPVGFLCYWMAYTDDVLTPQAVIISIAIGAFYMASALVGPKLRTKLGHTDVLSDQ